jgi:hypothetical protein
VVAVGCAAAAVAPGSSVFERVVTALAALVCAPAALAHTDSPRQLELRSPADGRIRRFRAELPDDLSHVLALLRRAERPAPLPASGPDQAAHGGDAARSEDAAERPAAADQEGAR